MDGMNVEQQFSLSWNNFHGNVSRELSALLGSGTLADVTLAVGGELLQAHRLVLAICSPYFKRMFQSNPHHHPIVVLRDVTHKAMRDLLQFMYHGEVSVKREDLTSFIATAELLQIKGLTNKETEDEDREQEVQELPRSTPEANTQQKLTKITSAPDDDVEHTIETKTQSLNEKIQRLKRASEVLQSKYYNSEQHKRPRSAEKARFDKFYDETPTDMSYTEMQKHASEEEKSDTHYDVSVLDLKTECDESDVIVTNAAMQYVTKQFDGDHGNKDSMSALQDGTLSRVTTTEEQLPVRYKYIYSRKGHKQIVHMNFVYTKHSTANNKTSWRCVQYFSINRCPATAETIDNMIYTINHQHNHEDFFDKLVNTVVYESTDNASENSRVFK